MNGFAPDYLDAEVRVSPNYGRRRSVLAPELLILHYTGMESAAAAEDWLCNPASEVSAHYLVHEDGHVVQMVPESERAWHAGRAWWRGIADVNSHSIGVEIANPGHQQNCPAFPDLQIRAVIALCRDICRRHPILPQAVLGHSDVAPGRKIDPGEAFPWDALAQAGIGHYVQPAIPDAGESLSEGDRGEDVVGLQSMLALYGYKIAETGFYDAETATVVSAFQRHFRPVQVDGVADGSTRDTLIRLLAEMPAG